MLTIDLDDPDLPPLFLWLETLQLARILHEVRREGSAERAAQRLEVSRFTVYRIAQRGRVDLHRFRKEMRKESPPALSAPHAATPPEAA